VTYRKNKEKQHSYVIGIPSGFHWGVKNKNSTLEYGYYLEFGTRYIPPWKYSFLRKWLLDYSKETEEYFAKMLRKFVG
jgi:hypothetical protein